MLKHVFIAVTIEKTDEALSYYGIHGKQRHELRRNSVSVDDELILSHDGLQLFAGVPAFVQQLGRETDRLDYYGKTIYPHESVNVLLSRMEAQGICDLPGWKWLYLLMKKAGRYGFCIVHLGI